MIERMTGTVQPYAWGSPTLIPELLGVEPTGEPQAELWLGAHEAAPSEVGGRSLADWIVEDPGRVVGGPSIKTFGPKLPFLLKVLAAARPLSLQAHPTRAQAEQGFAREEAAGVPRDARERLYSDDWPKPEVLCALGEMEVLCGFRDPDETHGLFAGLGVARALELVAPLGDSELAPADRLARVFERLLRMPEDERDLVDEVVAAAGKLVGREDALGRFAGTARELGEHFPRDPGVLAGLLMNRLTLAPYEAVYLPAGNLHAYLSGCGVEIMANSDNVIRGGLTSKHVDVPELLSVLDFEPDFAGLVQAVEEEPGVWRYPTPTPEFALWRVSPTAVGTTLPGAGSGRAVLAVDGSVTLHTGDGALPLERGQAAFVTADEQVELHGTGTAFVGASGVDLLES